jgi:Fic family protein
LPPSIQWDQPLANTLSNADFLLGKLAREGAQLPNPHLLIRPFITREAVLSSQIEGTQTTISEILAHQAGNALARQPNDLHEVHNYIVALDYGIELLDKLPLSLRLIREIHRKLMQGTHSSHATPGEFRYTQNWIGPPGCTLATAKYIPPPPEVLMECLAAFETFLHDRQLPALIHIALCHYQFEAIHPFLDGNGRVGRLLISLLLVAHNKLPSPLLYLSAFFEATKDQYYENLYKVSSQGNWHEWLIYFLNGVAVQCQDVLSRAERINKLLKEWELEVSQSSIPKGRSIIEQLAANPYLTIGKVAQELKVAYTTAQRAISKLEGLGIIKQTNTHKRDKVYCAQRILEILEEPTKVKAGLE